MTGVRSCHAPRGITRDVVRRFPSSTSLNYLPRCRCSGHGPHLPPRAAHFRVGLRFFAGRLSLFIGERIALLGSFGQPGMEALKRLEDSGARVYRTDRNGAVTF